MGQHRIATYKALYPEGLDDDGFVSLFEEELDSAFTADLACCDACYGDYVKKWPGLARDVQTESYPLRLFYQSSAFSAFFTEAEFLKRCREMGCPGCGAPLEHNLYPYNPRFDIPPGLEAEIEELDKLATATPFLALRHPLARRVFREMRRLTVDFKVIPELMFRARPLKVPRVADQFFAPPAPRCTEGRYNHAGRPVLYVAGSADVAFAEIGAPTEGCTIAALKVSTPQKVLDLADNALPSDLLQAITASALLSSPAASEGWDKPEYSFSRFVADCAINLGFTALRYPSVANGQGFNIVFFPQAKAWSDIIDVETIAEFTPP